MVILNEDVMTGLDRVPDQSVSLVFADPPYNIGKQYGDMKDVWDSPESYMLWCEDWLRKCIQKLTPNGSIYVMCSTQAQASFDLLLQKHLFIRNRIVWHYDSSGVQAKKYYGSLYEPILWAVKDPKNYIFNAEDIKVEARTGAVRGLIDYRKRVPAPYATTKIPGNVWYFPRVRYRCKEYQEHPTQKPEALLSRIIRASSLEGDVILDPFAGSFTTAAVAMQLNRSSINIEINEQYVLQGKIRLG